MEQTNKKNWTDDTPYTLPKVAIIAGCKSDQEPSDKAAQTLKELDIAYEQQIISAHRSLDRLTSYFRNSDAQVYICIASLSAAHTVKTVIDVPKDAKLMGLTASTASPRCPPSSPAPWSARSPSDASRPTKS